MLFRCGSAWFDKELKHRLDGKLVAITGASCGIGLSTAIMCAQRGASLLLLCRNEEKMSAAAEDIRQKSENPNVKIIEIQMDLADVTTVSKAISEIKNQELKIDVLVLNAGLAYYDPECLYNINSIQVVNHYSHFYLLNDLLENLKGTENDPARVVALSSKAHETALGDGKFWKIYSSPDEMTSSLGTGIKNIGVQSYCESKLANILHMREMSKRYPAIKFMSVHPGVVKTSFFRFSTESEFIGTFVGWWLNTSFVQWLQKSPEQGAQTSMYCICSPEAETGHYYAECAQSKVAIKGRRNVDEAQGELWNLSMKFVEENCQSH